MRRLLLLVASGAAEDFRRTLVNLGFRCFDNAFQKIEIAAQVRLSDALGVQRSIAAAIFGRGLYPFRPSRR